VFGTVGIAGLPPDVLLHFRLNQDTMAITFKRPIPVLIAHDEERLPRGTSRVAPDTRKVQVVVTIDRGRNVYGSLSEDFFVCRASR
jgi:hypothetical protein